MISMAKNVMQVQVLLHKLNSEHVLWITNYHSVSVTIFFFLLRLSSCYTWTSHPFVSVSESDYLSSMVMDDY